MRTADARARTNQRHRSRRGSPVVAHLTRTITRYRRDLALMTGAAAPDPADVDDLVLLEYFSSGPDPRGLIADRMLRIKTLEATVTLVREIGAGTV